MCVHDMLQMLMSAWITLVITMPIVLTLRAASTALAMRDTLGMAHTVQV